MINVTQKEVAYGRRNMQIYEVFFKHKTFFSSIYVISGQGSQWKFFERLPW